MVDFRMSEVYLTVTQRTSQKISRALTFSDQSPSGSRVQLPKPMLHVGFKNWQLFNQYVYVFVNV